MVLLFLKRACCCQQQLQPTWKRPVFVLSCQTSPSCAWGRPLELCHWFWSQNLWLSSGIDLVSDCQITGRDRTWTQTRTLLPDEPVLKLYDLLWNPWICCVEFEFFLGLLKMLDIETSSELIPNLIPKYAVQGTNWCQFFDDPIRFEVLSVSWWVDHFISGNP